MKTIVLKLIKENKTISTMESCTGGYLASEITNIEGSSEVLKFSAVTYSNEYKIKMGVDKNLIDKYSVYSIEVAKDMSKKISDYTNSSYGIGVTGKLNRKDKNNLSGNDSIVYVSIYDKEKDYYYTLTVDVSNNDRIDSKKLVVEKIIQILKTIV